MKYKDLDFVGLSKILRAHATQILPPGMRELKNVYASRSDNSVSLRPNLAQTEYSMPTLTDEGLQGGNYPEFLTGLYRVLDIDAYLYFSNVGPFAFENDERTELSTVYKEGTVTTTGTNVIVNGDNTEWLENIWPGCLIIIDGVTGYFQISRVESNTYLITSQTIPAVTDAQYRVLRTHPMSNGEWPMQFEKLGDLLVYNPANPTLPTDRTKISGPFYSDIGKADFFGVWKEFEPEIELPPADFRVVSAMSHVQAGGNYRAQLNYIEPLILAGARGLFVSCEQWLGDWDSENSTWKQIKEDWSIGSFMPTSYYSGGKGLYPGGNGWPTVDILHMIPYGSDSAVVGIDWSQLSSATLALADGSRVQIDLGTPIVTRTLEERLTLGPWMPDKIWPPVKTIAGPCYGIFNGYLFGDAGQYAQVITDPVFFPTRAAVNNVCQGEYHLRGLTAMVVGGVDEYGALIYNGTGSERAYYAGENALYDVTYMMAQDHGVSGIGTYVAVGENSTILYSDDGGLFWDEVVQSIGDLDFRCVFSDVQGWCAVAGGDSGLCMTTIDGETWEDITVTDKNIIDMSYDQVRGEFVLLIEGVEDPVRMKRRMRYGTGGQVTAKRMGIISTRLEDRVLAVIWDGTQFIAAGNWIWTSPTGETWTKSTYPGSPAADKTIINGDIFCLAHNGSGVVIGGGANGRIMRSADSGATWSEIVAANTANSEITSVIWDDYSFFCCRDDVILKSTDNGASWAEDATFPTGENPVVLAYAGPYLPSTTNASIGEQTIGFSDGNIHVICQNGNWYVNQNDNGPLPTYLDDWFLWEEGVTQQGYDPDGTWPYKKFTPGGFVAARSYFRCAATSATSDLQEFWCMSLWGGPGTYVQHKHMDRQGDSFVPIQEPGVFRSRDRVATDPENAPTKSVYNNLLIHNEIEEKTMATPILFWVHSNKLLISTDAGQTWSKGYPIIIPTRNGVYDDPVSDAVPDGLGAGGFWGPQATRRSGSLGYYALVSDGADVFMASGYGPEGVVFLNLTWDGLRAVFFDPDEIPAGPDTVPELKKVVSTSGEKFVFTFYDVTVS